MNEAAPIKAAPIRAALIKAAPIIEWLIHFPHLLVLTFDYIALHVA